jgi:hypothetical protein
VTDEKARRAVKPAGFVFSGLIAQDRKHWLDRYRPVTLEEHRPRCLNAPREVEEAEIYNSWSARGI